MPEFEMMKIVEPCLLGDKFTQGWITIQDLLLYMEMLEGLRFYIPPLVEYCVLFKTFPGEAQVPRFQMMN